MSVAGEGGQLYQISTRQALPVGKETERESLLFLIKQEIPEDILEGKICLFHKCSSEMCRIYPGFLGPG